MPAFPTLFPAPYQAMRQFAAPAHPRSELWRTVVGLFLALVLAMLLATAVIIPVAMMLGPDDLQARLFGTDAAPSPGAVVVILFFFLPQMLGLFLAVALLMRRGPFSLIGPPRAAWRNFVRVGLPLMGLWVVLMPLGIQGDAVTPNLTFAQQLPWLPAALLGLLIQTSTEELIFRGYLQQQLAARYASRAVWMVAPALLFGLAHYVPGPSNAVTVMTMLWAAAFGLATADLTARTGNLGAAIALHFTNNISAILLVGLAGELGGLTLYSVTVPTDDNTTMLTYLVADGIGLLVSWLLARLMLRV